LQNRLVSLGLIEVTSENRRRRLFDLQDFGLFTPTEGGKKGNGKNGK